MADDDISDRPSKIRKLDSTTSPEFPSSKKPSIQAQPLDPTFGETPPSQPQETNTSSPSTTPNGNGITLPQQPLSKSALKKLKRKEAWAASAPDRRLKRREQHKEKQARKVIAREELATKIASGEISPPPVVARPYHRPQQVPMGLLIDCDFEDKMMEKEIISLGSQITRCYSENKAARYRAHLCISSWGGIMKERFETVLSSSHLGWKGVMFEKSDFITAGSMMNDIMRGNEGGKLLGALNNGENEGSDLVEDQTSDAGDANAMPEAKIGQETPQNIDNDSENTNTEPASNSTISTTKSNAPPQLIYLSSDSPNTLTTLSPYTTYIIGGIVDKNRHKGLCYARAQEYGIPTAKLPIGEYMTMNSRAVLTVNHVVEIMLRWLELGDWGEAFNRVIPKRKGGVLKKGGQEKGEGVEKDEADVEGQTAEAGEEAEKDIVDEKNGLPAQEYIPLDDGVDDGEDGGVK